jgi:MraZ protein
MFMGEYQHNIDKKGRVFIPARLREGLGDAFVLTKGLDSSLFAFPMAEWRELEQKIRSLSFTNRDSRAFSRFLFSGASECEIDKQGRILIPQNLRDHAHLVKEAVIIGVSSRVEIWSGDIWENYKNSASSSYEDIAEKIVGFDFVIANDQP